MKYKIGDRVRYIRNDTEEDKATGFYPQMGTVGRVVSIDTILDDTIVVEWPKGTTTAGGGYVQETDVEIVPKALTNEQKQKYYEQFNSAIDDAVNDTVRKAQSELGITNGDITPMLSMKILHNIEFLAGNLLELIIQQVKEEQK